METIEQINTGFPEITFEEFQTYPEYIQREIISKNRIINTDTYNRTMDELRGPEGWRETETYALQFRRAPHGYMVIAGVEDAIQELTDQPITQAELDFAKEYYTNEANVPFFNEAMWQEIIDEVDGCLPFQIDGLRDGSVILPGDPVLRVTGPGELIAHFEHVFHRPFYSSLVATNAHRISQIIEDPMRFVEVGKRGAITENDHLKAVKAALLGGGIKLTSNDAAAAMYADVLDTGTIGHRYVQRFPSVEDAFRHAIESLDAVSLLVDLTDTTEGLEIALKLKNEYRETGKKIWVRLDSGDIKEQVRYYLGRCAEEGFEDTVLDKIVVEGIDSIDELEDIEEMIKAEYPDQRARVIYGAGGLLISGQTTRSDASSGFKVTEFEKPDGTMEPTMKFSNSPAKQSIPGKPTIIDGEDGRLIAQVGEDYKNNLFREIYDNGVFWPTWLNRDMITTEEISQSLEAIRDQGIERTPRSQKTKELMGQVATKYGVEIEF